MQVMQFVFEFLSFAMFGFFLPILFLMLIFFMSLIFLMVLVTHVKKLIPGLVSLVL